jgi:hypothetical protein
MQSAERHDGEGDDEEHDEANMPYGDRWPSSSRSSSASSSRRDGDFT